VGQSKGRAVAICSWRLPAVIADVGDTKLNSSYCFALLLISWLAGCSQQSTDAQPLNIYIESWEHISFNVPKLTAVDRSGSYSKDHNKAAADAVLRKYRKQLLPIADVMLGKNLHINDKGFQSEIDEVQEWLASHGFSQITFRLARCSTPPDIVRYYHKNPQQGDEDGPGLRPGQ